MENTRLIQLADPSPADDSAKQCIHGPLACLASGTDNCLESPCAKPSGKGLGPLGRSARSEWPGSESRYSPFSDTSTRSCKDRMTDADARIRSRPPFRRPGVAKRPQIDLPKTRAALPRAPQPLTTFSSRVFALARTSRTSNPCSTARRSAPTRVSCSSRVWGNWTSLHQCVDCCGEGASGKVASLSSSSSYSSGG